MSASATSSQKIEWPAPVRAYVQRCFAVDNAIDGISPDAMRAKLKQIIGLAAERNTLNSLDWFSYPLPQQVILQERQESSNIHLLNPQAVPLTSSQQQNVTEHTNQQQTGKKRKSTEAGFDRDRDVDGGTLPPWKQDKVRGLFEDRVSYQSHAQAKKMGV